MPAWAAGTFYEIPKTFHCARSVGRNVTQNPKTFCSARRGAPVCAPAPPPCETLSAGGHAGPPLRSTGTSYKTPKTFDSAVRVVGAFHGMPKKRSIVPVWAAGTFYKIPKTFHYARSGGRNVTQNPKTFCSARRGAPMCAPAPPPCETLSAGGHAGPPLRSTGTSYKTPKTFDSAVRVVGAFHGMPKKRSIVPVQMTDTFRKIPKTFHCARAGGWNVS